MNKLSTVATDAAANAINVVVKNTPTQRGVISNLFAGMGMSYAIYGNEKPKYLQVPIAYMFPSMYVGYHSYKNRQKIIDSLMASISNHKQSTLSVA